MTTDFSRLWREPMLHFLLIGFALFLYYDLSGGKDETLPKRIHVEQGQVRQLAANFELTWSRPPTQQELDAMVEGHVREEVLYREALAMGLDRDDPLVRRRMRMKLEFILEDLSAQDYSDEVLNDYMHRYVERFRDEPRVSFQQVYLNPDKRQDLLADAKQLLARLDDGANPVELGDPTLSPRVYQLAQQNEIARDFGEEFARELVNITTGDWAGPIYSPFGAHLLKVDRRIEARLPALTEIRDRVLREYQAEQSKQQKDVAYQKLRETYVVTIESLNETVSARSGLVKDAKEAGESQ